MSRTIMMGMLLAASLTGLAVAEEAKKAETAAAPAADAAKPAEAAAPAEAKFDPGVPAPKIADDYYAGAEKVIVHVTMEGDEKKYLGVLGNVSNYMKALDATGKKTDAIIVMNGDGLGLLKVAKEVEMNADAKLPGKIAELKEKGVKFQVCYNTLTGRKIKFDELFDAKPEDVIPSGVAEAGRLQAQGYQLLKP
ncbi:MAG TPA: DsrE family protein [Candidatus Thiothrix moscowensis]|uniref:DsrE family protein n=1 Tax=unclassified Thiothrix TaxID=2636184 RepID=UPI0025D5EA82|nr:MULTISPECIES: DsrE family protein [unclassified Thiothrix]HRJ51838.1 DsrE family protein [Candidatus Thiothrix moscowensis]HRJ92153.1 DsrE family protein [Candidatus Thiothrix moscowensis]